METARASQHIRNFVYGLLMLVPRSQTRLVLFVGLVVLGLLCCYAPASLGLSESAPPMRHHWTVEEIDSTDRVGLASWARDICAELDIDAAAEAINVAPTADAVVGALTDGLPENIRRDIAKICFDSLRKDVR